MQPREASLDAASSMLRHSREGKIPSFRVGNEWRFRTDVIERWMVEKSTYARLARNFIESGVN